MLIGTAVFGPVVRQHIMVAVCGGVKLLTSWPVSREETKWGCEYYRSTLYIGMKIA
jgi:hypothetical protein